MLDELFYKVMSLMEVKFILVLLLLATTVDIIQRVVTRRKRRDTGAEMNSVLALYQENLQSGRHTNGVRHFRTNSQNIHAGYKEV